MKKIKFCERNFKNGTKPVYKRLKGAYAEIEMKKKDCLGNCKTCKRECFALVKSGIVSAPTPELLTERLTELIESR
ncbi:MULTISPECIES: DUF1450 domain-containing protein [Cohnella]|uniref:DUF1450 domain-containing protein n=1 Tax=Cohnella TaxID=329857 RepID=UPI0009BBB44C|nr:MULTISPECIES: DUF1450 domain-containing protein [Cohnella]MBN2984077.1 DUF1450 domain-containing protein [Cohnella algarum]